MGYNEIAPPAVAEARARLGLTIFAFVAHAPSILPFIFTLNKGIVRNKVRI